MSQYKNERPESVLGGIVAIWCFSCVVMVICIFLCVYFSEEKKIHFITPNKQYIVVNEDMEPIGTITTLTEKTARIDSNYYHPQNPR